MRALYVILPILGILVLAYRYYSAFIAAHVLVLDDTRTTPAHTRADGHNYHATTRWVLFGHHFAAIAGVGPADRSGAGGAVRLRARADLAGRRRLPCGRRARPHHPLGIDASRRQLAGRDRPHRDRPRRGHDRRRRNPLHRRHRARRPRARRRQRAVRRAPGARSRSGRRFRSRSSSAST